jgi:hypothetical protein
VGNTGFPNRQLLKFANKMYQNEAFSIVAGEVFDSFYYKNEAKIVMTDDFMTAKSINHL